MYKCTHGVSFYSEEAKAALAAEWALAVEKLSVTFTAAHGGGWPPCLIDKTAEERIVLLRKMGFRVKRRYEIDELGKSGETLRTNQWADLSGGISVNLSDGWVWGEVST